MSSLNSAIAVSNYRSSASIVTVSFIITIMVYGTMCIDRLTDRPCLSHSCDTDTLHVPTLPCHTQVNSAVCSGDSYKTENADNRKAKSRDTHATNCKAGSRERPANLFILALPCRCHHASLCFQFHVCQFFSPVTSHKPTFTLSYISITHAHCILDTYAHVMHMGMHRPHPPA